MTDFKELNKTINSFALGPCTPWGILLCCVIVITGHQTVRGYSPPKEVGELTGWLIKCWLGPKVLPLTTPRIAPTAYRLHHGIFTKGDRKKINMLDPINSLVLNEFNSTVAAKSVLVFLKHSGNKCSRECLLLYYSTRVPLEMLFEVFFQLLWLPIFSCWNKGSICVVERMSPKDVWCLLFQSLAPSALAVFVTLVTLFFVCLFKNQVQQLCKLDKPDSSACF